MKKAILSIPVALAFGIALLTAACNNPFFPEGKTGGESPETTTYTVWFDKNHLDESGWTEANPVYKDVTPPATTVGTLPEPPTRTDWQFTEWNIQADGKGTKFTKDTTVNKNTTVYAQWKYTGEGDAYTVYFNKNHDDADGWTEANPSQKDVITPDTTVGTLPAPPTRSTDWDFVNWNTSADGSGTEFTASTTVTDNVTVYAQWDYTGIGYGIRLIASGEEGDDNVTVTPAAGEDGDTITITYTVANIKDNNSLTFSGTTVPIEPVTEAGSGTRTYTISAADASDKTITINAEFRHSDLPDGSVIIDFESPANSYSIGSTGGYSGGDKYGDIDIVTDPYNDGEHSLQIKPNTYNQAATFKFNLPEELQEYKSVSFRFVLTGGNDSSLRPIYVYVADSADKFKKYSFGNPLGAQDNNQFVAYLVAESEGQDLSGNSLKNEWHEFVLPIGSLDNSIKTLTGDLYMAIGLNTNAAITYLLDDIAFSKEGVVVVGPASLSPTSAPFDKYGSTSPLSVTMNIPDGNGFVGITGLTSGTNYTRTGNTIILNLTYLRALSVGQQILTFNFSKGAAQTFTVNVTDTTPSIGTPTTSKFDLYNENDITVRDVEKNGHDFTISKDGTPLTVNDDYTLSGNTVVLKKENFTGYVVDDVVTFTFAFDGGASYDVTITIEDTTPAPGEGSVSPTEENYDKKDGGTIAVSVSINNTGGDNATFTSITGGAPAITAGDYEISDGAITDDSFTLTMKESYLKSLTVANHTFTFTFTNNTKPFELDVTDTRPPVLNPATQDTAFDKKDGTPTAIDVTFNRFENTFTSVTGGSPAITTGGYNGSTPGTVTLNAAYLDTLSVGEHTFTFNFIPNGSPAPAITVTVTDTRVPTISPDTGNFEKTVNTDIEVTVERYSNTLASITNGGATLTTPGNYTVTGNKVTLLASYLKTLPVGSATLTFNFTPIANSGATASSKDLTLMVTSNVGTPSLSPTSANFDLEDQDQGDIVVTVTLNNNALTEISGGGAHPIEGKHYTISGGPLTINNPTLTAGSNASQSGAGVAIGSTNNGLAYFNFNDAVPGWKTGYDTVTISFTATGSNPDPRGVIKNQVNNTSGDVTGYTDPISLNGTYTFSTVLFNNGFSIQSWQANNPGNYTLNVTKIVFSGGTVGDSTTATVTLKKGYFDQFGEAGVNVTKTVPLTFKFEASETADITFNVNVTGEKPAVSAGSKPAYGVLDNGTVGYGTANVDGYSSIDKLVVSRLVGTDQGTPGASDTYGYVSSLPSGLYIGDSNTNYVTRPGAMRFAVSTRRVIKYFKFTLERGVTYNGISFEVANESGMDNTGIEVYNGTTNTVIANTSTGYNTPSGNGNQTNPLLNANRLNQQKRTFNSFTVTGATDSDTEVEIGLYTDWNIGSFFLTGIRLERAP